MLAVNEGPWSRPSATRPKPSSEDNGSGQRCRGVAVAVSCAGCAGRDPAPAPPNVVPGSCTPQPEEQERDRRGCVPSPEPKSPQRHHDLRLPPPDLPPTHSGDTTLVSHTTASELFLYTIRFLRSSRGSHPLAYAIPLLPFTAHDPIFSFPQVKNMCNNGRGRDK